MTPFFRLHSGGVVRNGSGVLFVGPSGAGKSTLVLRLVSEGFELISDDEVWIDPESQFVHPSPRPVFLKGSAWDFFPRYRDKLLQSDFEENAWWLEPEDIRPNCRAAPSPIWGMVFLGSHVRDHVSLEEIGQPEALAYLLNESMNFPEFRSRGLSLLVRTIKSARLFKLCHGDLDQSTRLLTEILP